MRRAGPIRSMVLVLAFAGFAAAQAGPGYTAAMRLFDQHHFRRASTAFAGVEQRHPGQTDALLFEARALINLDRIGDADPLLVRYVQAHPRSDNALSLLAFVRFREDHPRQSLRLFTRAAALKTPVSDDFKIVAFDYALLRDYDDAAKYLQVALKFSPGNLDARYHLGRVRYLQNRFAESIAAFRAVLAAEPHSVRAENNLGLALEGEGHLHQAMACYRAAIGFSQLPGKASDQPYINLGSLLTRLGRTTEARPLLEHAVMLNPRSGRAHYELGKACLRLNLLPEAQRELQAAIKLEPRDASAHYQLGMLYRKRGRTADERRELTTASRLRDQKP